MKHLVTVRDLKISLSLRDTNFKTQMKSINTAASSFNRNLIRSNDALNILQGTINGFNGANIPNQIHIDVDKKSLRNELASIVKGFASNGPQLDIKINGNTLKKSVEDWINDNLGKGQFIKHIPLKLQWGPLKDSINAFIATADKHIDLLPLQLDTKKLVESLDKFKGKLPLGLDWIPLRDSINGYLDEIKTGKKTSINDLPLRVDWKVLRDSINEFLEAVAKGKHGIIPLKLTQDIQQQNKSAQPGKDEDKPETLETIGKALGVMVGEQNKTNVLLKEISKKTGQSIFKIG